MKPLILSRQNRCLMLTGLICAALGALGGCAHYQAHPISAETNAAGLTTRTLADADLHVFLEANHVTGDWPRAIWDLNTLTLAGIYFSPELDVARAQVAQARAAEMTAGQRPNPTVGAGPAYNTTTSIPSPWIVTTTLDVPIEIAGKREHRRAEAAHLTQAARFQLASVAWQVRSRVRQSLLALYAASEREARLKEQEAIQAESVRLVEAQLAAGAVSPFEVTQARVGLNQTRFALHDAEAKAAQARVQLAEAIGVPAAAIDGVRFDFSAFKSFPTDVADAAARQQALTNRADVLAGLAEYAAAESALQLEIAKQYPDVHLSPGYEYDQADHKWGLGISLELPLLNQNQGPIAEAEARRRTVAARFNALQARVLAEIDQAVAGYRASVGKVAAAEKLSVELDKQLRAAQGMLEAGEISRTELAQRQLELATAALAQLDALVSAQEALGALEDALQSPATLLPVSEESPRLSATTKR